jgi:hypothetical protein
MANRTRPSAVCGTMIAVSPGRNDRSRTTWTPWLGAINGSAAGSAMRRTVSLNGPVALTTTRASMRSAAPDSTSAASTPVTSPSGPRTSAVTLT